MEPREPHKPFTCLVIDAPSRALLLALVKPRHEVVFADHITLEHDPADVLPLEREFIGRAIVVEVMSDEQGQAVTVQLDRNTEALMKPGTRPHITLSCAPGIFPAYSNRLEGPKPLGFELVLSGTVKTVVPKVK